MRKVISVMLCVILMLTLAIPAYAVEVSQEDDMMAGVTFGGETTTVSEYEIALQKTEQMPMSVKSTGKTPLEEYKEAFDLRATLSPQELVGMGYTNDEVAVLKAYDEGNCSFEYAATYASASLTSSLYCVSRSATQYKVRYTWAWDKMPTGTGEGGAALAIYGLNSSSQGFDVSKSGYLSNVNYFNTDNNSLNTSVSPSVKSDGAGVSAEFDNYKMSSDYNHWTWAKSGYIQMTVTPAIPGGNQFAGVKARGTYAHSVDEANFTFGISINLAGGLINIAFQSNPGGSSTLYGAQEYIFTNDGSNYKQ